MRTNNFVLQHCKLRVMTIALACFFSVIVLSTCALAQNLQATSKVLQSSEPNARMLLSANELIYDHDNQTIVTQGNVQIIYNKNRLTAQKVIYNKKTKRVIAEGLVEIIDADGNKIYSDKIDMTEDLSNGFVNAPRIETTDNTRFAAESTERSKGQMTVLNNAAYTACEPCNYKPDSEILWQVKARKIIWNGVTKTIRFEDSKFEFLGVPFAWLPVFEMPDPTVKRKSGFMTPKFSIRDKIGFGIKSSYFWDLAPNYDLMLSAKGVSKQGLLSEAEWRHRLKNGSYNIKIAHINQIHPNEFDPNTIDNSHRHRYMAASKGNFEINPRWKFGWDILAQSDGNFARTYNITNYDSEVHRSEVYLTGLSRRNHLNMHFYNFEVQDSMLKNNPNERDSRQPIVLPHIDYTFYPQTKFYDGELKLHTNIQGIYRKHADYALTDWDGIQFETPRLSGIGGNSFRLTTEAEWKRNLITNSGLVLTPSFALRGDVIGVDTNNTYDNITLKKYGMRGIVTLGLEARYPMLITTQDTTHMIEPTAQLFVRNNEKNAGRFPNEDAQSFVFDATTLFQRNKFSGYDRLEGGTRANIGVRYSGNFVHNWTAYGLAGQSFQLAGQNPFKTNDLVGVGDSSGLDKTQSDYVAMLGTNNQNGLAITARGRFDNKNIALRRAELELSQNWRHLQAAMQYAYIGKQAKYGYARDRRELSLEGNLKLTDALSFTTNSSYDFTSKTFVRTGASFNYLDECFGLLLGYQQTRNPWSKKPSHKLGLMLSLRTIANIGQSL